MGHVACSPKNRLFEPFSGRFTPIRPTNHRRERNGLPTLATVLPPPTPNQRGEVVRRPSPAGCCLPPTAEFPMNFPARSRGRGPLVGHWTGDAFPFPVRGPDSLRHFQRAAHLGI